MGSHPETDATESTTKVATVKGWRMFPGMKVRHFVDRNDDGSYSVVCGVSPFRSAWAGSINVDGELEERRCRRCLGVVRKSLERSQQ